MNDWTNHSTPDPIADMQAAMEKLSKAPPVYQPFRYAVSLETYEWLRREVRYERVFWFFRRMFTP